MSTTAFSAAASLSLSDLQETIRSYEDLRGPLVDLSVEGSHTVFRIRTDASPEPLVTLVEGTEAPAGRTKVLTGEAYASDKKIAVTAYR